MSVFEIIQTIFAFGMFTIALITLIIQIIDRNKK